MRVLCVKTAMLTYLILRSGMNAIHDCVTGSDFVAPYRGETEANIRSMFRRPANTPWLPGILLIDEVDALIPDRKQLSGDSSAQASVVNTVIAAFGGATDTKNLHLLCATNFVLRIDDAMKRPGRMDTKQFIGLPSPLDRTKFFSKHAGDLPSLSESVREHMKALTTNFSGANMESLVQHLITRRKLDVQRELPMLTEEQVEMHPRVVRQEITLQELTRRCLEIVRRDAIKVGGEYFPDLITSAQPYMSDQYHHRLLQLARTFDPPPKRGDEPAPIGRQLQTCVAMTGLIVAVHKIVDRTGLQLEMAYTSEAGPTGDIAAFSQIEVRTQRFEKKFNSSVLSPVSSSVEVMPCLLELEKLYQAASAPQGQPHGIASSRALGGHAAAEYVRHANSSIADRSAATEADTKVMEDKRRQWLSVLPKVRPIASWSLTEAYSRMVASFARFSSECDFYAFRILNDRQFFGHGVFEEKDIQRQVEEELDELEQYDRFCLFIDVDSVAIKSVATKADDRAAGAGDGSGSKRSAAHELRVRNEQLVQSLLNVAEARAVVNGQYKRVIVLFTTSQQVEDAIKARLNWPDPTAELIETQLDTIWQCRNCHADFKWRDNDEEACHYHWGGVSVYRLQANKRRTNRSNSTLLEAAVWLDSQKDTERVQELKGNDAEPTATPRVDQLRFEWTCCGKPVTWLNSSIVDGVADGCRSGRHQSGHSAPRARFRTPSLASAKR